MLSLEGLRDMVRSTFSWSCSSRACCSKTCGSPPSCNAWSREHQWVVCGLDHAGDRLDPKGGVGRLGVVGLATRWADRRGWLNGASPESVWVATARRAEQDGVFASHARAGGNLPVGRTMR